MPVYPDFGSRREGGISYTSASASWEHGCNLSVGYLRMEAGTFSVPVGSNNSTRPFSLMDTA
jgi:hypothetical protein